MDIKDLEYFLVICRHQNLAKAARSLYITPQGLSRIVKNLEAELGIEHRWRVIPKRVEGRGHKYYAQGLGYFGNLYLYRCVKYLLEL